MTWVHAASGADGDTGVGVVMVSLEYRISLPTRPTNLSSELPFGEEMAASRRAHQDVPPTSWSST